MSKTINREEHVVFQTHKESKQGSSVRVVRIELSKSGRALLTSQSRSIPESGDLACSFHRVSDMKKAVAS